MTFCTLFNSNYLDKGIVMIDSLKYTSPQSKIYVLCMDASCKEILDDYYSEEIVTIDLVEFEDEELLAVKTKRSPGEYCWTCTAKLIKYVMDKYDEDVCTYVDSDLFFYTNPDVLLKEMTAKGCTVQVISHRFPNSKKGRRLEAESGKNCVQFNTFTRESNSIALLNKWIEQCINECSVKTAGDQKYTSDWGKYSFVNISENGGAGIAPWNINRFRIAGENMVYDVIDGKEYRKVFYHFQGIINSNRFLVCIDPLFQYWRVDKKLVLSLYSDYLKRIEEVKEMLENRYGILPMVVTYISDTHSDYSIGKRIIANMNQPLPILCEKMSYRIRRLVRKKMAVIDVRNIYQEVKSNDNA